MRLNSMGQASPDAVLATSVYEIPGIDPMKQFPLLKASLDAQQNILRKDFCGTQHILFIEINSSETETILDFFNELQLPCILKKDCDFNKAILYCSTHYSNPID